MAKYFCVRLHALFGVALALGLVLARKSVDDPGRPPGIVLSAAFSGDETAPFFGFLGAAAALVFSCN